VQVRYASEARHPNIAQLLDVFVEFKQIVIVVCASGGRKCCVAYR
jgi:hypothetical protein